MANRNFTPVMFGLEKNIVTLAARVVFNAGGVPVLDTINSKGICSVKNETIAFTASTVTSSSFLGTVSSFRGIYPGMNLIGSTGALQSSTSIVETRTPAGAITLSGFPTATGNAVSLFATGGRYRFQFGAQEALRLDSYNKVLGIDGMWFETTSSFGSATASLIPAAPDMFVADNRIAIRTIPQTTTSGSTDCSIVLQTGQVVGSGITSFFRAGFPANGEVLHVVFTLGNSTAR